MDILGLSEAQSTNIDSATQIAISVIEVALLLCIGLFVAYLSKKIVLKVLRMEKINEFFAKFDSEQGLDQEEDLSFVNLISKLFAAIVIFIGLFIANLVKQIIYIFIKS